MAGFHDDKLSLRVFSRFLLFCCFLLCSALAAAQEVPAIPCGVHSGLLAGRPCFNLGSPAVVSAPSPFSADCNGYSSNTHYHNAPVEPWVAVDPKNPQHFIGVWQQDRWANGAASGLVAGTSFDGGLTWSSSWAHFSTCSGGTF